jgi:F-type H+-transporting ATPase subunit b
LPQRAWRAWPLAAGLSLFPLAALAEEQKGMPQLDFGNPLLISQIVWMGIIFAILYYVLSTRLLPQVASVLATRAERIAADLDAAAASKAQADAAVAELMAATRQAREGAQAEIAAAVAEAKAAAALAEAEAMLAQVDRKSVV